MKEKIIVSAVNLVDGGPLIILRKCLEALSRYVIAHNVEVVALVHNKDLCDYPNITYIEIPWAKKNWLYRIYCEYFYFKTISQKLTPRLWLSLHDMTPKVKAPVRAVYCHNATPFYHPTFTDARYNYKEFLFSLFYRFLYQINIHENKFVIVQQKWLKDAFVKMFDLEDSKVIVAKPIESIDNKLLTNIRSHKETLFFFPAFPRTFKNFEVICEACRKLEKKGIINYRVILTLNGTENRYAKSIYKRYNQLKTISFCGLLPKEQIDALYEKTDCLIFPSKLESWGLPISEFAVFKKPMIVADLPYAYETATGAEQVCFFNPYDSDELAERMEEVINNNNSHFNPVLASESDSLTVVSWEELFNKLLNL